MDNTKPAAERVRPILQAMERSIDAARQRRLHQTGAESANDAVPAPTEGAPPAAEGDRPTRLKARPKRPAPLSGYDREESFRSRAS